MSVKEKLKTKKSILARKSHGKTSWTHNFRTMDSKVFIYLYKLLAPVIISVIMLFTVLFGLYLSFIFTSAAGYKSDLKTDDYWSLKQNLSFDIRVNY